MYRAKSMRILALAAALLMIGASASAASPRNAGTVLDLFLEPDARAKPMARMWFPDAGAGEDDGDMIEKQIFELADKGFGGVEVAMLMSYGVKYFNEEARVYGWGTDNWTGLMKKVLKAAAKVPGGFQVDVPGFRSSCMTAEPSAFTAAIRTPTRRLPPSMIRLPALRM